KLKNTSTFRPLEISIYEDKGKWFSNILYSGENSYGGKKEFRLSLDISNDLIYSTRFSSAEL
ncbi:TPA: hypothetical protein ACG0AT_003573, partial [Elizabethkingia anophelis]